MKRLQTPEGLSIAGEQAWNDGYDQIEENGGYKAIYFMSLYCYSKCADIIKDGYDALSKEELTVEHENNKEKTNTRKNPTWAIIAEAQTHQREYAKKLGFTPYDEGKITITKKEPGNELDKMLQEANIPIQ